MNLTKRKDDRSGPESDQEFLVRYYFVCLIDALGQQTQLERWARLPEDGQPTAGLVEALRSTVGVVLDMGSRCENFYRAFDRPPLRSEELKQLSREQKRKFERIRKGCPLHTQQFGDTFVFYSPVVDEDGDISMTSLYKMIGVSAMAIIQGLARGSPIRGALALGPGTELSSNRLYGPVLAQAHHLESKRCGYPRVVVAPEALELMNLSSGFSRDAEIEHVTAGGQAALRELVALDSDGRTIVDFLGKGFKSMFQGIDDYPKLVYRAYQFAKGEAARFEKEEDQELAARYDQLVRYFRRNLQLWGMSPT